MSGREQGKLYYLYMMSDGEVSEKEENLFKEICRSLELDVDDIKKVKAECMEIRDGEKLSCIDVVTKNIETSYEMSGILNIGLNGYISGKDKARILWNLINLGYADSQYTIDEREVVDFLREHWKIPEVLYQEMIDVAETCLALEKHRSWIEELPDSNYKLEKRKAVKKNIKHVQEMVLTAISETKIKNNTFLDMLFE